MWSLWRTFAPPLRFSRFICFTLFYSQIIHMYHGLQIDIRPVISPTQKMPLIHWYVLQTCMEQIPRDAQTFMSSEGFQFLSPSWSPPSQSTAICLLDQGTSPEWNVSLQPRPLHLPWLPLVSEQRQNSWVWPSTTPIPRLGLPHSHSSFSLCTPAVPSSLTLLLAKNCPSGGLSLEQSSAWCLLVLQIPGQSSLPRETLPYSHTHTLIIHLIAFYIFAT